MAQHALTDDVLRETMACYLRHKGSRTNACQELKIAQATLEHRLKVATKRGITGASAKGVELPSFPDDDLPTEQLIASQTERFKKRWANHQSKQWFPIRIKMPGPIGLSFFGDPHVDDNYCNWELLQRHCDLHRKTEGLFAVNIGDTTNNWVGRLTRLFGNQDTSQATARKFARWLLLEAGVTWLLWVMGNHDSWNEGSEILRQMGGQIVTMEDWSAKFKLVFPNGRECKVWAQHDFKGYSMWNSLHGPQRAAHTKAEAHIYAAGHTHNWALHQEESASRDFTYWLARARGYKFIDSYAEQLGHASQKEGAAILAVIDPAAKTEAGFVQCFADLEEGVEYLKFKRRKAKA